VKILVPHIFYRPEPIGNGTYTADMCEYLAASGDRVQVIAPPPYYPWWKVQSPYSALSYSRETIQGVEVTRCPIWVPAKGKGLKRVLHELSFALSSLPVVAAAAFSRPDVVFVIEPSFFNVFGALLAGRLSGAVCWMHVQDFEFDIAFDMGQLGNPLLRSLAFRFESWAMRRFDVVTTISGRMRQRLHDKGLPEEKTGLFPNWVDTKTIFPMTGVSPLREKLGLGPEKVVALFSGTLGPKQAVPMLIEAARLLGHRADIHFLICGDGSAVPSLKEAAGTMTNLTFLPLQPLEELNNLLNTADIHLLPQDPAVADLVMPSKLIGMAASGRPVAATAHRGTEVEMAVRQFGYVVPPGDAAALARAVEALAADPAARRQLGKQARQYAESNLSRQVLLARLRDEFSRRVAQQQSPSRSIRELT
jgi:colanic acid biosynthesis glycosyl transferase WcaI